MIGVLLILAGSTAQAGWLFVLAAGVLATVGASFFFAHRLGHAQIRRHVPGRVRVGDELAVRMEVSNSGKRFIPALRLEDSMSAFEPAIAACDPLAPGATASAETVRTAILRGVFEGGPVRLSTGAPFGFVRSTRAVEVAAPVVVVPHFVELPAFPLHESSSYPGEESHVRARPGGGLDYLGVREYRKGDPLRAVHWRSAARAGRLIVREYEEDLQTRVTVIISGRDWGVPPDSAFESLVGAAASVARFALKSGHPVDLIAPDARLTDANHTTSLDWLARLRPVDEPLTPLVRRASQRMSRRGTIVLLTPSSGRAGTDLPAAVHAGRAGGTRPVAVAALASSWAPKLQEPPWVTSLKLGRGEFFTITKGKDLKECLGA